MTKKQTKRSLDKTAPPADQEIMSDKFSWGAGTMTVTHCANCTQRADYGLQKCAAFPDGIPNFVWENRFFHTKPYPGQINDIVFTPYPSVKEKFESGKLFPAE